MTTNKSCQEKAQGTYKMSLPTQTTNRKFKTGDFPVVDKNPPFKVGDMGLIPGQGTKIPHAVRQLSPHATTREKSMHHNDRSHI